LALHLVTNQDIGGKILDCQGYGLRGVFDAQQLPAATCRQQRQRQRKQQAAGMSIVDEAPFGSSVTNLELRRR